MKPLIYSNAFAGEAAERKSSLGIGWVAFAALAIPAVLFVQVFPSALGAKLAYDLEPSTSALNLVRPVLFSSPQRPWHKGMATWYGPGYHGQKTSSGEIYRRENTNKVAVPPIRRGAKRPIVPYGTWIELRYGSRTITVKANDLCSAGTWDLSDAGMRLLSGKTSPQQKLAIEWRVAK